MTREGDWLEENDLQQLGNIARARAEGRTEKQELALMNAAVSKWRVKARGRRLIEIIYHPERGCGLSPRVEHRGSRA
jgi:hypothetical protein